MSHFVGDLDPITEDAVQVRTRHTPSFGVARLLLAPGEPVVAESGTLMATSYGMAIEPRVQGGVLRSMAKAALGGGSTFITTYTAPPQGGWVDLAPALPGDIHLAEFDGMTNWCVSSGCWLASSATVQLDAQWSGFRGLFGGEPGFLVHTGGQGALVMACYGAVDVINLAPGEFVTVDSGHLVGYIDSVQTRLRAAAPGGPQSLKTGEGLVFDFAGPGQVLTQTRNPRSLINLFDAK